MESLEFYLPQNDLTMQLFLLLLLSFCISYNSFSQTTEEIIQKYLYTIGEDFKTLKSYKQEYETILQLSLINEYKVSGTSYEKKPNLSRTENWIEGDLIHRINAFDGNIAWKQKGNQEAEYENEQIASLFFEGIFPFGGSLIAPLLINAAEDRAEMTFLSTKVIDEQEYYELEYERKGQKLYFYINTSTHLLEIRSQDKLQEKASFHHSTYTLLKDYRKVGNYLMFHKQENWINGSLSSIYIIKQIIFNPELPDSLFEFPEKP